jgi:hypothetical protein
MRLLAVLLVLGLAVPAEALSRKFCRRFCDVAIQRCVAVGFPRRHCRRVHVRACRQQGFRVCQVTTTSTLSTTSTTLRAALPTTTSTVVLVGTTTTTAPKVAVRVLAWANYNIGVSSACSGTVGVAIEITNQTTVPLPVDGLVGGHAVMDVDNDSYQCGTTTGQVAVPQAVREDFCSFVLTSIGPEFCLPCSANNPVPVNGTRRCAGFYLHSFQDEPDRLRYRPFENCLGYVPFGCPSNPNIPCPPLPASGDWSCRP